MGTEYTVGEFRFSFPLWIVVDAEVHRDGQFLFGDRFDENRRANLMESPREGKRHAMRDDGVRRQHNLGPRISSFKCIVLPHLAIRKYSYGKNIY